MRFFFEGKFRAFVGLEEEKKKKESEKKTIYLVLFGQLSDLTKRRFIEFFKFFL